MKDIERVVNILKERKWHITFAESCTAGLCAGTLANVSGASSVFEGSYVTYSCETKHQLVGVSPETIAIYDVVSEEVAKEMAVGCKEQLHAEVGCGITGYAGPTGGTQEHPTGTVCFGIAIKDQVYSFTVFYPKMTRQEVRYHAVDFLFETLAELL